MTIKSWAPEILLSWRVWFVGIVHMITRKPHREKSHKFKCSRLLLFHSHLTHSTPNHRLSVQLPDNKQVIFFQTKTGKQMLEGTNYWKPQYINTTQIINISFNGGLVAYSLQYKYLLLTTTLEKKVGDDMWQTALAALNMVHSGYMVCIIHYSVTGKFENMFKTSQNFLGTAGVVRVHRC